MLLLLLAGPCLVAHGKLIVPAVAARKNDRGNFASDAFCIYFMLLPTFLCDVVTVTVANREILSMYTDFAAVLGLENVVASRRRRAGPHTLSA